MNEYDKRQYELMWTTVGTEPRNVEAVGQIEHRLRDLLAVLMEPDVGWVQAFETELGDLEQVYAYNLEYGQRDKELGAEEAQWVANAIDEMRSLLKRKLSE